MFCTFQLQFCWWFCFNHLSQGWNILSVLFSKTREKSIDIIFYIYPNLEHIKILWLFRSQPNSFKDFLQGGVIHKKFTIKLTNIFLLIISPLHQQCISQVFPPSNIEIWIRVQTSFNAVCSCVYVLVPEPIIWQFPWSQKQGATFSVLYWQKEEQPANKTDREVNQ